MDNPYTSVGRCIYCGNDKDPRDEHILPYSLGGLMVLPKASCLSCADKIKRFEGVVGRNIYGHFRVKLNVQTRHPNERKRYLNRPIKIGTLSPNGERGFTKISPSEYPIITFTYKFDTAGILKGLQSGIRNDWFTVHNISSSKEDLDAFIKKYNWDGRVSMKATPVELARVIAKIAYSYVVAEFKLGNFEPFPHIIDTILGRTEDVAYLVGGEFVLPIADPAGKHLLGISVIAADAPLIVVDIRLFPAFELPQYHAVVGYFDLQNPQQAAMFKGIAEDSELIKKPFRVPWRLGV